MQPAEGHARICLEPGVLLQDSLQRVSQEKVSSAAGGGESLHGDGQWCSIHQCSQWAWRSLIKGAMQYTREVLLFLLRRFIKFNEDIEAFH